MRLANLERLTDEFDTANHPGSELGEFLLTHSNSGEYLVGVLTAYLDAVKQDVANDRKFASQMMNAIKSEQAK